jgi:predicted RNA binding protein YcfA (HicA-like mRNA interferase family)
MDILGDKEYLAREKKPYPFGIISQKCAIFVIESKMTWNEFRKMILRKGWKLERHGGKHDIYRKTGRADPLLVERHWNEEIKPNLQKRLLKQVDGDEK